MTTSKKKTPGVRKGSPRGSPRGSLSGNDSLEKKPAQKEILRMLTSDFLTPQQIADSRQISLRMVQKHIKKLKESGLLNIVSQGVRKEGGFVTGEGGSQNQKIRLHNEQFCVKILWHSDAYHELQKKNRLEFDGNTVMLHNESIDIYSNRSFWGETPDVADFKSSFYWMKFFRKLEIRIKCILVKDGSINIDRCRAEYSETGNELATMLIKEHQKIRVVGSDGYCWLLFDNSHGLRECETIHPRRSGQDMKEIVQPFFNDLRNNDHLKVSELSRFSVDTSHQINEIAHGLRAVVDYLRLQIPKPAEEQANKDQERGDYIG